MSQNKVNEILGASMDKIKQMVDVNTVVASRSPPRTAPPSSPSPG